MLNPLLLEHYDPSKTLVATDACAIRCGAILLQRDLNGHEHAVSHMVESHWRNYSLIGERSSSQSSSDSISLRKKIYTTNGPQIPCGTITDKQH